MGNWRTVRILGTCDPAEAERLRAAIGFDWRAGMPDDFGPLTDTASLCGLNDWPAAEMDRVGNLAERGYTPMDVVDHLERLLPLAPSLAVKVHCGGDHEDTGCIATITVAGGKVTFGPPEVADVGETSPAQVRANVVRAMAMARRC